MTRALFEGLVFDEYGRPAPVVTVGSEPCYVVDDDGFRRHIPSEQVDRQVMQKMTELMQGHEEILSKEAAKMLGQDDIFSRAMILNQLKHIDQQFDNLVQIGIPEETRAYLGMVGFKIVINLHGEVLDLEQPGMVADDDEGGGE